MATQTTGFLASLVGTRAAVRGWTCGDGDNAGLFQAVRFDQGADVIGWQQVDDNGDLLGILDEAGQLDEPGAAGNRTWSLCDVTRRHVQALRRADLTFTPAR